MAPDSRKSADRFSADTSARGGPLWRLVNAFGIVAPILVVVVIVFVILHRSSHAGPGSAAGAGAAAAIAPETTADRLSAEALAAAHQAKQQEAAVLPASGIAPATASHLTSPAADRTSSAALSASRAAPAVAPVPAPAAAPAPVPTAAPGGDVARLPATPVEPVSLDPDAAQALKLSGDSPAYPEVARIAQVQGIVVAEAIVGRDGTVEDLRIVSGPALLQSAAAAAIRTWRYRPWVVKGRPVRFHTTITLNFLIRTGAAPVR